jgi:phage terminase small subunit
MILTPCQSRFIDEYLIDLNGAQAAIRAGYSTRCARQIATEVLSKPYIQAVIDQKRLETEKRRQIQRDGALRGFVEAFLEAKTQGGQFWVRFNTLSEEPKGELEPWQSHSKTQNFHQF